MNNSILVKKQVITKTVEGFRIDGGHGKLVIKIRYDDKCGNGHNSFSITADMYRDELEYSGGCIHDDIREFAPEYAHLIKWHLMSSDEPMHYVANTMYHARNTDCNGLLKGEYSAYELTIVSDEIAKDKNIVIYKSGQMYNNKQNNPNLKKSNDKELSAIEEFKANLIVKHETVKTNSSYSLSEGKEPDIEAARNCAIWEDATLEQLQDKEQLQARLPVLIEEFKSAVESLGMVY